MPSMERKVYSNGQVQTVKLKPRTADSARLSRQEKAAAREEKRRLESAEADSQS